MSLKKTTIEISFASSTAQIGGAVLGFAYSIIYAQSIFKDVGGNVFVVSLLGGVAGTIAGASYSAVDHFFFDDNLNILGIAE